MGLLRLLGEDKDMHFPRRLFGALARIGRETSGRVAEWDDLEGRWHGWGCYLVLAELPSADLVLMRAACAPVIERIEANETISEQERASHIEMLRRLEGSIPAAPPQ
jgi:hypothetical protein